MRRMIPQKLIDAIKSLASLAGKIKFSSGKVKVNGDFEADGITSKGIANTGALANIGDVAVSGDISATGKLTGGPLSQFVKIMDAPESTTLTDEQIAQIEEGVFINGTFLGMKNPILGPSYEIEPNYRGLIIGYSGNVPLISAYLINKTTKEISISNARLVRFENILSLNGLTLPINPASTGTFVLKCVDGVLTWVADA